MQIPLAADTQPGWDYVALGHYHVYRRIADHVYYSGSIDYTSTNPWGELAEERATKLPGKGFIERDLTTGKQTFHPLAPARPVLDLPPIDGRGLSAEGLDAAVRGIATEHGAAVIEQPGDWYGFDSIHVRRCRLDALWAAAADAWTLPGSVSPPRAALAEWARLGRHAAEVRSLAGVMRYTRQPVERWPDGGTLSLY